MTLAQIAPQLTFDTSAIIVTFFGSLLALLVGIIGVLSRSWFKDLRSSVEETRAEAKRADAERAKQLDAVLAINERQNVEIAKLGVGLAGLDHRVTDIDTNLGRRVSELDANTSRRMTDMEARQHRLATQLQNVFLGLNIKMRRGDMPGNDDEGGDGP